MSGGKSQKSTTKTELPPWLEDSVRTGMGIGEEKAKMGYVPYTGPDVAALDQQQVQSMQAGSDMASMFGLGPKTDVSAGIPKPQQFAGGISGYSSMPLYEEAQQGLADKYPGLKKYLDSFFIDPVSGKLPKDNAWDRAAVSAGSSGSGPATGGGRGPGVQNIFNNSNPFIRSGNSR